MLLDVHLVSLKFKDPFSIDASADTYNIHRYVYLMGAFCDRLKLCSTAAPDCQTAQWCILSASFLATMAVINPQERKLPKCTSADWPKQRQTSQTRV